MENIDIFDGWELFKKAYKELETIWDTQGYDEYFEKYDVWIVLVPIVRLKDHKMWMFFWESTYNYNYSVNDTDFIHWITSYGLDTKEKFLAYQQDVFDKLMKGEELEFDGDNDMTVVLSHKDLETLFCFCDTLITSVKETRLFTKETCRESIYYFRATKENKFYHNIVSNEMMRDVCKSFMDYLDKQK